MLRAARHQLERFRFVLRQAVRAGQDQVALVLARLYGVGASPQNSVGGIGTVGTTKVSGSDGQPGFSMSPNNAVGGSGGGTYLAGMTNGNSSAAGVAFAGNAGSAYGGGGSGCTLVTNINSRAGGAGAAGVVRIWEFY